MEEAGLPHLAATIRPSAAGKAEKREGDQLPGDLQTLTQHLGNTGGALPA